MSSLTFQTYRERIAALSDRDPRHVEAWMRIAHGTLDHLGPAEFESEVCIANACVASSGDQVSEALAASYGL